RENIDLNGEISGENERWLLRIAICQDALALAEYEHDPAANLALRTTALSAAARQLQIDMSLTDVQAFTAVVKRRSQRSTRLRTPDHLPSCCICRSRPCSNTRDAGCFQAASSGDAGSSCGTRSRWLYVAGRGTGRRCERHPSVPINANQCHRGTWR